MRSVWYNAVCVYSTVRPRVSEHRISVSSNSVERNPYLIRGAEVRLASRGSFRLATKVWTGTLIHQPRRRARRAMSGEVTS